MLLEELIKSTQKESIKIQDEYRVYEDFQLRNPWYVNEMISNLKMSNHTQDIPTFERIISFKDTYFIDDYTKVYRQLKERNPYFVPANKDFVMYYSIEKDLYKKQLEAGLSLGDKDIKGRLVTGSNLILNTVSVNIDEFLSFYYSINN